MRKTTEPPKIYSRDESRVPFALLCGEMQFCNWAVHFIPLREPEQAIGSNAQFVSLSPRGTSGERAGEKGNTHKEASSPRLRGRSHFAARQSARYGATAAARRTPGPLLPWREEREKRSGAETIKGNEVQSPILQNRDNSITAVSSNS